MQTLCRNIYGLVYIHTHIHICMYTYTRIHAYTYVCIHIHTHTHTYIHGYKYIRIRTYMYMYIYISRNPSKSFLAHDAVATAVLHKHDPIIRVGACLIQFVYRPRLRFATESTRNRNVLSPFFVRVLVIGSRSLFTFRFCWGWPTLMRRAFLHCLGQGFWCKCEFCRQVLLDHFVLGGRFSPPNSPQCLWAGCILESSGSQVLKSGLSDYQGTECPLQW